MKSHYQALLFAIFTMIFMFGGNSDLKAQKKPYNVVAGEEEKRKKEELEQFEEEKVGLKILLQYNSSNSSSFYDGEGDNLTHYADTNVVAGKSTAYGFNDVTHNIELFAGYEVYKNLTFGIRLPFSLIYYDENYINFSSTGSVTNKVLRYEDHISQLDFIGLGANYVYTYKSFFSDFNLNVAIPTAAEPIFGDSTSFSRYFPFEIAPQITSGIIGEKYAILTELGYRIRGGEYSDMLIANLNFMLTSVPDTEMRAFIQSAYSFDTIEETAILDARHNPYKEIYMRVGFAFKILVEKTFHAEFIYRVTLFGINTRKTAGYSIVLGLHL
ncbi:MAG: hypothetical protein M9949_12670 [Candidatus Kapabacteria bacterium]|nr:hypothetical protein [Candidatus Kapabacteria bacterium]